MNWAVKPLILPSNGFLGYDSIVEVKEPDVFLVSGFHGDFFSKSESDYFYLLLKRYTNFSNPGEVYFKDVYFIWLYIYSLITQDINLPIEKDCYSCGHKNSSFIDLTKTKTNFIKTKPQNRKLKVNEDITIEYRYRKLKDNIWTGNYRLENEERTALDVFHNFIFPQIEKLFYKEQEIEKSKLIDLLKNKVGLKWDYARLIEEASNEDWGLEDQFVLNCQNCGTEIFTSLGDPLSSSVYIMKEPEERESVNGFVALASFKVLSFEEILSIPYSQYKKISDAIIDIKNPKNNNGYLDEMDSALGI